MNEKIVLRGMGVIRVITGLLLIYHGLEVFSAEKMNMYAGWESIQQLPFNSFMLYAGKLLELVAGICLVAGLFTRWAGIVLAVVMFFICFYIGNGKFWYEDQHPFLFGLMGLVFTFSGPGAWALDHLKGRI